MKRKDRERLERIGDDEEIVIRVADFENLEHDWQLDLTKSIVCIFDAQLKQYKEMVAIERERSLREGGPTATVLRDFLSAARASYRQQMATMTDIAHYEDVNGRTQDAELLRAAVRRGHAVIGAL